MGYAGQNKKDRWIYSICPFHNFLDILSRKQYIMSVDGVDYTPYRCFATD